MNKEKRNLIVSAVVGVAVIISMVGGVIYLEQAKVQRDSLIPRLQNAIHINLKEGQALFVYKETVLGHLDDTVYHFVDYVEYNTTTLLIAIENETPAYVFYSLDNILFWGIE